MKSKSEFLSLSSKTIKHVCLPSAPSFQPLEANEKTVITMEHWLAKSSISRALKTKQHLFVQQMKWEKQLVFLP